MAAILTEGDPRLRARCSEVGADPFADDAARLVAALHEAQAAAGFGRALAAPQIGIARRLVAMDLGAGPFVLVDPEITWRSDEMAPVWDDCFSVPGRLVRVLRHRSVSLRYRDDRGRTRTWRELPFELAELVQHELDHLDGVLMVDRTHGDDAIQPMARRAELVDAVRASSRLSLERIATASAWIDPAFLRTPLLDCEPLAEIAGCRLALKIETINPVRSFKARGTEHFVARSGERGPFVCASAGNFGQGMAYACRTRGLALTVFTAEGASSLKIDRMRALGATVVSTGADFDAAKRAARAWAVEHGARFVEDGREPLGAEGAGTIAVELVASGEAFDSVVVPVGDGALVTGIARWLHAASPATRVIGVVSGGAPAMRASWQRGSIVDIEPNTIADGIAVRSPVDVTLTDVRALVDDLVEIDDPALVEAMRLVHLHAGLVVEPAAVAGLAAILGDRARFAGERVATIITGGNVTAEQMRAWL